MKFNSLYPSKYLKADDVAISVTLAIQGVTQEEVGQDTEKEMKPVLHFVSYPKSMVLNKTNGMIIADLYGDETDDWIGKRVTLYSAKVPFGGKMVDSIRIKAPDGVAAPSHAVAAVPAVPILTEPTVWQEKVITEVQELSGTKEGKPIKVWYVILKSGEKIGTVEENLAADAKGYLSREGLPEIEVDITVAPGNKPGVIKLVKVEPNDVPF